MENVTRYRCRGETDTTFFDPHEHGEWVMAKDHERREIYLKQSMACPYCKSGVGDRIAELESTIAAQAAVIEAFKNWAADALYNDKPKRWTWLVDILHDAETLSQAPACPGCEERGLLLNRIDTQYALTRDEVLNDHWGTEFEINDVLNIIDHICIWRECDIPQAPQDKEGRS
jgi:hypothetical protein